jgi:hypothetical protein
LTSHEKDRVRAGKDGTPSSTNFDYSGPFAETVRMGNPAIRFPFRRLVGLREGGGHQRQASQRLRPATVQ